MNATKRNMDKQKNKRTQGDAAAAVCSEKDQVRQTMGQNMRNTLK